VHCIELHTDGRPQAGRSRAAARGLRCLAFAMLVAGCTAPPPPPPAPVAAPRIQPRPGVPAAAARNWDEFRLAAARRIVAANPGRVYEGKPPEVLLAIPVIEVELNGDGSIRRLSVTRYPRQAKDTVPLALEAIRRAAPFGSVAHLPRPWSFVETFLFDDERRFKPRSLES
jgi:hypothetical protein